MSEPITSPAMSEEKEEKDPWELNKSFEEMQGEGEWVQVRGRKILILPALIDDMKHLIELISNVSSTATLPDSDELDENMLEAMLELCLWSIRQAYPNVTMDDVRKIASIKTFQSIFMTVLTINDLVNILGKVPGLGKEQMEMLQGPQPTLRESLGKEG